MFDEVKERECLCLFHKIRSFYCPLELQLPRDVTEYVVYTSIIFVFSSGYDWTAALSGRSNVQGYY